MWTCLKTRVSFRRIWLHTVVKWMICPIPASTPWCTHTFATVPSSRESISSPTDVKVEHETFLGQWQVGRDDSMLEFCLCFKNPSSSQAGVAQWISATLQTKGSLDQFPVWVHAWVAGQVPSNGHTRDNHTLMFLSLSFSLPTPLKVNK